MLLQSGAFDVHVEYMYVGVSLCEEDSFLCALQSGCLSCHTLLPSCHSCTVPAFLTLSPPQRPAAERPPHPQSSDFYLSEDWKIK